MNTAIGEILPLALGIAISPIPIIAAILMLLSPKARTTSLGFLLGWLVGVLFAVTVFTLLSSIIPEKDPDAAQPVAGAIKIVLGLLLLVLALRQWRSRPRPGETATLPAWMGAIDSMSPGKALGLAFLLAAVNPKNLLLSASAGITVGTGGGTFGSQALTIIIFTLVAASSVGIPVISYLVASARMQTPLESLRGRLVQNNTAVMTVVLLILGVTLVGKGIGNF